MEYSLEIRFEGKYPKIKENLIKKLLDKRMSELNGCSRRKLSVLITDNMSEANAHTQEPDNFTVLVLSKSISSSCDFEVTYPEDFADNFPVFLSRIH